MADLIINPLEVSLVRTGQEHQLTLPTAEAVQAGQYIRPDANGMWVLGNATNAGELGDGYFALSTAAFVGDAVTGLKQGLVAAGNGIAGLPVGAKVYVSDADGTFADAQGTVEKVAATVVAAFGDTQPDNLLAVDLS